MPFVTLDVNFDEGWPDLGSDRGPYFCLLIRHDVVKPSVAVYEQVSNHWRQVGLDRVGIGLSSPDGEIGLRLLTKEKGFTGMVRIQGTIINENPKARLVKPTCMLPGFY